MAIVIEEEKRIINWFAVLVVMAIFAIIGVAAYYLFFINPSSINVVVPSNLGKMKETIKIKFNPGEVLDSPALKDLKIYVTPIEP